ncbi:MAG: VWA domain-containing protein [Chloroflexi bacterium]|nr:VWA domain-containing protein [Chloroflexota bacterium]
MQSQQKSLRVYVLLLIVATLFSGCAAPMAAVPAAQESAGAAPAAAGGEAAASSPAEAPAAAAPAAESARPAREPAAAAPAAPSSHRSPTPVPYSREQRPAEPVTAGVVDDNEQWNDYLDYRARHDYLWVNERDITERITIQVWDEASEPVHDATVEIYGDQQQVIFTGRTDAGGRLFFHPRALDGNPRVQTYFVTASKGYVAQRQQFSRQESRWTITLIDPPAAERTQLDLLFLIDATGSMSDEIDKLKNSMAAIASQIDSLPERPSVRYSLVAYRDRGDAFVVKAEAFTSHLSRFQTQLSRLQAEGGGDYPESLNEALHIALHNSDWTREDAVRLVLLVADAPPHLDYQERYAYDTDMLEAVAMGVKIFPVGASGLDEQGEYIFRQMAQFTGGKFVFLTYEEGGDASSGPGTETTHDVDNYSVDTLDRLVVRLVREELAKLPQGNRQ